MLVASLMRERAARARFDKLKQGIADKAEDAVHILSTDLSRGDIGLATKFKKNRRGADLQIVATRLKGDGIRHGLTHARIFGFVLPQGP